MKRYFWNLLIAIDQLFNTMLNGYPDETISSRIGKKVRNNNAGFIAKNLCKVLDKIDNNHCEESIEEDEGEKG